jgi:hypothetical protein
VVSFIGGWNRTTQRKPPTYTATHWKTVSHNVVSNTPDLSGIRTHNTFCHISTLLESWCKLDVDIQSMLYFHLISFALSQRLIGFGSWCLTPLSTIFQLYQGGHFLLVDGTGVHGENLRPTASHWRTSSHYHAVSNTPRLSGIRTQNVSADRYWLHKMNMSLTRFVIYLR